MTFNGSSNGSATRRVVVTGVGLITSLGHDLDTSWQAMVEGKSGARTNVRP